MPVNAQSLLRRVRSVHLEAPGQRTDPHVPVVVLYVPSAARDRASVRDRLARAGAVVSLAADVPDALQMAGSRRFGLVLVDLAAPRAALSTVRLMRAQFPDTAVVGVIDPAQPSVASDAIDAGVTDLLPWPCDEHEIAAMLAAARDGMPVDLSSDRGDDAERLFEYSPSMRAVAEAMKLAASRKTATLIVGEPGSGRQLVARTLHDRDHDYVTRPFVVIDCAGDGPSDLERRLFGMVGDRTSDEDQAGTAERATRASAVVAAQGGTLLLTNFLDAPARVQVRMARLLRDREVFQSDLQVAIPLDVRLIASVGPDVSAAVDDGRLRADLAARIAQVRIDVPPLRTRREDVPVMASHLLHQVSRDVGASPKRFSRAAVTLLSALPWPGNARELRDVVTALVRRARGPIIGLEDVLEHATLESGAGAPVAAGLSLREARAGFERAYISATLLRHRGRVGEAARALGIQRTNLYRKVRQLKVSRSLLCARQ